MRCGRVAARRRDVLDIEGVEAYASDEQVAHPQHVLDLGEHPRAFEGVVGLARVGLDVRATEREGRGGGAAKGVFVLLIVEADAKRGVLGGRKAHEDARVRVVGGAGSGFETMYIAAADFTRNAKLSITWST